MKTNFYAGTFIACCFINKAFHSVGLSLHSKKLIFSKHM